MRIVFRADASLQIGTGHVTRCLTLADALRERRCECVFLCRDLPGALLESIRRRGYAAVALSPVAAGAHRKEAVDGAAHAGWLGVDWQTDAAETRAAIGGVRADWLVVDHYAFDVSWERELRHASTRIMVIDDLADREHDCDLLLNQNLIADLNRSYESKVPARCGLMLGPNYALLQPPYAALHSTVVVRRGSIKRVLVYFGGADADNLTGKTIEALIDLGADVDLDVVINSNAEHAETIRRQVAGRGRIALHADIPSLAPLLARADAAIGAGGATTWERCCLGLPSLVVTLADNQKPIAAELARRGLITWHGHKDEVSAATLAVAIRALLDEGSNEEQSERCRQLVDGRGTERVSTIMLLDAQTPLRARVADWGDENLILAWANDPLVRRNAFTTDTIDAAEHHAWFGRRMKDTERCRLYVIETATGLPIGQVRFQKEGDSWEVHYSLDATVRGRGLAKPMLTTAIQALRSIAPEAVLFGRVKSSNAASSHVFQALGFSAHAESHGIILYRRPV